MLGCGVVRMHTLQCGDEVVDRTTRMYPVGKGDGKGDGKGNGKGCGAW